MKKGDDFFRVTFNRSSEEIRRFEDNMHKFTDKCRVSRPHSIAVANEPVHAEALTESFEETPMESGISADDFDAMLRAMGLL
jgi:hypothetical protein